jgi:2-C-methyl-D-erythritol 2,4-cyclodiphosphate synthase
VIQAAFISRAAAPGLPVTDTLKVVNSSLVVLSTQDRSALMRAQTPQVFDIALLKGALTKAIQTGNAVTDDCSAVEALGKTVQLIQGEEANFKITTPEDLERARRLVSSSAVVAQTGLGYDVHRLVRGRPLILGGITIPHSKGLDGHSDADVLIHAVIDAILGGAHLGDIGKLFPDSNPKFKDISSLLLLEETARRIAPLSVLHIDATIVAQEPKLASFRGEMEQAIASALLIPVSRVNVKFKTEEGLGFTGTKKGMKAMAVALVG